MIKLNWAKHACCALVLCATTAIALRSQTLTTLLSFRSADGSAPWAGLVQASDGNLYGTTELGGADLGGTVFKVNTRGTLTTLYSFCSRSGCTDGIQPLATLLQAGDGNFYGTTDTGGANGLYYGTIFKITPGGTLTTLYSFCSQSGCPDGYNPSAALAEASSGDFYGTTYNGGANGMNDGTVFKITPGGTLTTLYSFCSESGCADGAHPNAPLLEASDGNFYGTTTFGGVNANCESYSGCGTIFRITSSGVLTTVLTFDYADGAFPSGALLQTTDGSVYGTTLGGGAYGQGAVFKISPAGRLGTLYSFCSETGCTDGSDPQAGLIQATDGNLYGTTTFGGSSGDGTVFKITPSGSLLTLHSFTGGQNDGALPVASLLQDTNGMFYGTTRVGGAGGFGIIFSLSMGFGPFVETQPTSGKAGARVRILGTNLTGATSVTFNGTAAVFKVVSSSLISTTVPNGATSGTVQVVTPSGTLSSNVPFRVLP